MSVISQRRPRKWLAPGTAFLALGAIAVIGSVSNKVKSQVPEPIIRVEEDWVLVLNEPDGNVDAPQYHTVMSPFPDFQSNYAQVLWNYRETPEFTDGGVQMQGYYDDTLFNQRSMEFQKLDTEAETITWTQSLQTDGSTLSFEVKNGSSATWGSFGKDMRLDTEANLYSLGAYDTQFSADSSGVTYGANRVDSMKIVQVRRYGPSGLLSMDTNPYVVFELEE